MSITISSNLIGLSRDAFSCDQAPPGPGLLQFPLALAPASPQEQVPRGPAFPQPLQVAVTTPTPTGQTAEATPPIPVPLAFPLPRAENQGRQTEVAVARAQTAQPGRQTERVLVPGTGAPKTQDAQEVPWGGEPASAPSPECSHAAKPLGPQRWGGEEVEKPIPSPKGNCIRVVSMAK